MHTQELEMEARRKPDPVFADACTGGAAAFRSLSVAKKFRFLRRQIFAYAICNEQMWMIRRWNSSSRCVPNCTKIQWLWSQASILRVTDGYRLSILSPCSFPLLHIRAHVSPSFICALALAHRPRNAAALSSSVHTQRRFLTHAPRCGRACHSPASAYADSDILAGRVSAALRSRYADLRASPVPYSFLALSNSINNAAASGSIHAAAARHAPAPYPALRSADSMPCLPVLSSLSPSLSPCGSPPPPLYLLDLLVHLRPHSFWLSPFPVSLPPPSRASMRRSINAAAPSVELLELPRGARADLRAASLYAAALCTTCARSRTARA
ncbi:hypothetical protein B0H14DRAFT_2654431 [Mycena olivaceomarginata]|nr:hypothetical protein B0H14DRAFT_2654431 [Mycena olivaceomarginata]